MLCFKYFSNILNTDLSLLSMQRLKSARQTEGGYVEIKNGAESTECLETIFTTK